MSDEKKPTDNRPITWAGSIISIQLIFENEIIPYRKDIWQGA